MSGGGYQPYRKGPRRPGAALTAMRRGRPQYMAHPLDAQRTLAKRAGLRAALTRRRKK